MPADSAERKISLLRYIAAPLLEAVERAPVVETEAARSLADNARIFAELVETTIGINNRISETLAAESGSVRGRWLSAEAVSAWTAAHYRATAQVLSVEDASGQIDTLLEALGDSLSGLVGEAPRPTASLDVMARSIKALAPVAASVARYSFGRNAADLLSEVTQRLTRQALDISARLGAGADVLSSPLYIAMLEVTGLFYKQAHRGEMDRLLAMPAEERRDYIRAHNRRVPMDPVWDAIDLQLGMLEAMAAHIPLPDPTSTDGSPV